MSSGDLVQLLGDVLAEVAGVGGDEDTGGDVDGRRVVEVQTGLDECEVELVVEVLEGLVKGEGDIVGEKDEFFK